MTGYERMGTPAQQREAAALRRRMARAEQHAFESQLEVLRNDTLAAERVALMAAARADDAARLAAQAGATTFMERAAKARDWARNRWPESPETCRARLDAAIAEAERYEATHAGTPKTRDQAARRGSKALATSE